MVFSSPPLFLDPPNWQQHGNEALHLLPPPHSGGAAAPDSQTRPSSMSERAREAKIPAPEGPLKCPRCDSTNTKFCYFNNYNLSQPRHFCKGCRRYWTRGGALRNVPVGGGCRRNNKRRKSHKPAPKPSSADLGPIGAAHGDHLAPSHADIGVGGAYHQHQLFPATLPPPSQFSFMASLQGMSQFSSSSSMGEFQQLPYLAGFGSGLYPFQSEGMVVEATSYGNKGFGFSHLSPPPLKAEERIPTNTGGGLVNSLWTDLSGIGPSSCTTTRRHSTIGDLDRKNLGWFLCPK